jgi:pyruvate/2-oxoglutarate dehydrogenase complex dihydrolipoamide dehydrogenase (E3) component
MLNCHYLVIGSGETGLRLTLGLVETGKDVVLVEQQETLGGSFLNDIDIPKTFLEQKAASFSASLELFKDYKETFSVLRQKRKQLAKKIHNHQQEIQQTLREKLEAYKNLQIIHGQAHFFSKSLIEVDADEDKHLINFNKCILATGKNSYQVPSINGLSEVPFLNQFNIFKFEQIPTRLGILGVSISSLEVASIYSNLGVKVQVFDRRNPGSILPGFDRTGVNAILTKLSNRQVEFNFKTNIQEAVSEGKSLILNSTDKQPFKVSHVYASLERLVDGKLLNLSKGGIRYSQQGLRVSGGWLTSNPKVCAFGEVVDIHQNLQTKMQIESFLNTQKTRSNSTNLLNQIVSFKPKEKAVWPINEVGGMLGVLTVGLTETKAVEKYGSNARTQIFVSQSLDGVVKCVYTTSLNRILGLTATGRLESKFGKLLATLYQEKYNYTKLVNILASLGLETQETKII